MELQKQGPFSKKVTDLPDTPSPAFSPSDIKSYMQTPIEELATTFNNAVDKLNEVSLQPTTPLGVQVKFDEVDAQLAEKAKQKAVEISGHRYKKAMITLIDDDGRPELYTKIKPVIEASQVPLTAAIITSRVGQSTSVTLDQLYEMQNIGIEIVNHTKNHIGLADMTLADAEQDIKESSQWLRDRGFNNADCLVYPFGSFNVDVKKMVRKYHRCAVSIDIGAKLNNPPLTTFALERVDFEKGVDFVKSKIDEAVANNSWVIVMIHAAYSTFNAADLQAVIDYAKTKAIDFVTMEEGMNKVGNLIDIGEGIENITIDALGGVHGSKIGRVQRIDGTGITNNTPITSFLVNCESLCYILYDAAQTAGFPTKSPGVLKTVRMANDYYSYQEFKMTGDTHSYKRNWNTTSGTWDAWTLETVVVRKANDAIVSTTTPAQMPSTDAERLTITRITDAGKAGYPETSPGTLYTNILGSTGWAHQIYVVYGNARLYKRYWDGTAWSAWSRVDQPHGLKDEANWAVGIVNANSSKDMTLSSGFFTLGSNVVANPYTDLPAGILYNAWVSSAGVVKLRLHNLTASNIDLGSMRWMFKVLYNT